MADRIIYKNHCTPQEKLAFSGGDRWYLDSDCGRKLTGICESKSTSIGTLVTGTFPATISLSNVKFIYIRNTDTSGSNTIEITIGGSSSRVKIGPGESFASDIGANASDSTTFLATVGVGLPSFEYIVGS